MPSSTVELPPADLARYRVALQQRLRVLSGELADCRARLDALQPDATTVLDRKDQADRSAQAEVDEAEYERDLTELQAVQAALQRLGEGRYGLCVDCGEPIGSARLAVQPAAARCAACQATGERSSRPRG
jgi:DnaK suppressor protein